MHTVTVDVGCSHPTANITTSPAGPVFSFSFSFALMYLVIIDPAQQGDAQMNHPLGQISAVPDLLCGVVGLLYCV